MGKTSLATNMAFNAARAGVPVAFFSLEMSSDQLATRILAEETEIPSEKLRRGDITDDEFTRKIVPASKELAQLPFYIDDTGAISISLLRSRARRLKRTNNIGMIIIDYLQLVRGSNSRRNDNRVQEISEVTQALKALAKDLNVPVIALSQLSRAVESRDDKRPQLSDLRESGAIEQDADIIMFIYRDEYYTKDACKEPGVAEVIISKQRNGPTGTVKLAFLKPITKFESLAGGGGGSDF